MKKFILIFVCICGFILSPLNAVAQSTCSEDFTVNTVIVNSTCQSNGEITVTLEGETSHLFKIQYGLEPAIPGGFQIDPQPVNVLSNIPPGYYTLTVRAFCEVDEEYEVVKTLINIEIGGNYEETKAEFNYGVSRNSYAPSSSCPNGTGIIAMNVTKGSGSYTFTIVDAPDNNLLGPVTYDQNGTLFTMDGYYPPGTYRISVYDGCFTAAVNFDIDLVSGFPTLSTAYIGFRPNIDQQHGSCSVIGHYLSMSSLSGDQQRYRSDGMYEVAMAKSGGVPTNWQTLSTTNGTTQYFDISPAVPAELHTTNSVTIYRRVKGCDDIIDSTRTYIPKQAINGFNIDCLNQLQIYPWTDYEGVFCYPLTLQVKDSIGNIIHQKIDWWYNQNTGYRSPLGDYEGTFTVLFIDAANDTLSTKYERNFSAAKYAIASCDEYGYRYSINIYNPNGKNLSCYKDTIFPAIIRITDPDGIELFTDTIKNPTSNRYTNYILPFDRYYGGTTDSITIFFPDGTSTVFLPEPLAEEPEELMNISIYSSLSNFRCVVDSGQLLISPLSGYRLLPGATIKITGPSGFKPQTITVPAHGGVDGRTNSFYTAYAIYPKGLYTFEYDDGNCVRYVEYDHPGIYNYKDFGYTSQPTCQGLRINPTGNFTYGGNNTTTYFRLLSGPNGYNTSYITSTGYFTLTASGTYTLGIMGAGGTTFCAIATLEIDYTVPPPLSLDTDITSAYICVGGPAGNITIGAKNGVAPYTYRIWDENKEQMLISTTSSGIANFQFGSANTTYTVEVTDACNNSFDQRVTVVDLENPRLLYTSNGPGACPNEALELKCLTLGETEYYWTGPNDFSSNVQNPVIENFNISMEGWYKVEVQPEFCDDVVVDSIYVRVYTPLTITGTGSDYMLCIGVTVPELDGGIADDGSGHYTYQWQYSLNGSSNWTDIQDANESTLTPNPSTEMIENGVGYYRMVVTGSCETVNSDTIILPIQYCGVPVNPNLMNKVIK